MHMLKWLQLSQSTLPFLLTLFCSNLDLDNSKTKGQVP